MSVDSAENVELKSGLMFRNLRGRIETSEERVAQQQEQTERTAQDTVIAHGLDPEGNNHY